MSINKNGIIKAKTFSDPNGNTLVNQSQRATTYSYTPSTGTNSCITGWEVDFSSCKAGEEIFISLDIEWNGLQTSSSSGTFAIWFQGSRFRVSDSTWQWNGGSGMRNVNNGSSTITSILTAAAKGQKHFELKFTLASDMPGSYSKEHFGVRSDYANGTGTFTMKNLVVVPTRLMGSKIYADKIIANDFIEI